MKCTSHTRTLSCLAPKNRRRVVKCVNKQKHVPPPMYEEIKEKSIIPIHDSQLKDSKQWEKDEIENQNKHNNELYKRVQLLAREEFNEEDFKRQEYDSHSLLLYKSLITELNLQRHELKYISLYGDKWRSKDELYRIKQRMDTSANRIGRFKNRERAFKKKYFQDENYIIKGIDID